MTEIEIPQTPQNSNASAVEALANAAIGFAVSWLATFYVLGYNAGCSLAVTGMFFVLSFSRAFLIREAFPKWQS